MKNIIITLLIMLGFTACSNDSANHNKGIYMLVDTSGTYTKELEKTQRIINYTLAKLEAGDSFVVASIDTGSFSEKDTIAKVTLDDRPSRANQQKRAFQKEISKYIKSVRSSRYTDITGGILQATEYLNEKNPSKKTIMIFSDMKEELKKGYIRDIELSLDGFDVIAMNVTKLNSDNVDPRKYMKRMDEWKNRVELGGGNWEVINDLQKLDGLIEE